MTNVLIELLEDLQNILSTCPDVHWRSRVQRAVNRAGGIRTYYDMEEAAEARGRADERAEIVAWLRTLDDYYDIGTYAAESIEYGEHRPKGGG